MSDCRGPCLPSSCSPNSTIPVPPRTRHVRATRSARSRIATYRTAPEFSTESTAGSRRIRTAGIVDGGSCGGLWAAIMSREVERCLECIRGVSSDIEGSVSKLAVIDLRYASTLTTQNQDS